MHQRALFLLVASYLFHVNSDWVPHGHGDFCNYFPSMVYIHMHSIFYSVNHCSFFPFKGMLQAFCLADLPPLGYQIKVSITSLPLTCDKMLSAHRSIELP